MTMIKLGLSDFIDIVTANVMEKPQQVADVKHKAPYHIKTAFYAPARRHIESVFRNGLSQQTLITLPSSITNAVKKKHYPSVLNGIVNWWNGKTITYFQPPKGYFTVQGLDIMVSVPAEVGLVIDGQRHVLRLHFPEDPMSPDRMLLAAHLMHECLSPLGQPNDVYAILNTRAGQLMAPTVPVPGLTPGLRSELAYIATLWPNV